LIFGNLVFAVMERERILKKIAKQEAAIRLDSTRFAGHILKRHRGKPATACHECNNFRQALRGGRELLGSYRRELQQQ